jgi:hypothetical protein
MRNYPEVIAVLFLTLTLGAFSKLTQPGPQPNRLMVLTTGDIAAAASMEKCEFEELRRLPIEFREQIRSEFRNGIEEHVRTAVSEIKDNLKPLK